MTYPNGKPPIDRAAPDAELPAAALAAARDRAGDAVQDAPMPAVENEPGSLFRPAAGISSVDVFEVALMYLLHLTNSPVAVETGALRLIALPAERVAQLSESARRFMQPLDPHPQPAR